MNARFAGALDPAPGSKNQRCLLTAPTTLYTGLSSTGNRVDHKTTYGLNYLVTA